MDDSPTVTLSTPALESIVRRSDGEVARPVLTVRCYEGDLSVYMDAGVMLTPHRQMRVRYRFDDAEPSERIWQVSGDFFAVGQWDSLFSDTLFIFALFAERLFIEFTPYGFTPQVVEFDLSGLSGVSDTLYDACPSIAPTPPSGLSGDYNVDPGFPVFDTPTTGPVSWNQPFPPPQLDPRR